MRAAADVEHARVADAALPAGPRRRRVVLDRRRRRLEALGHRERGEHEPLRVHVARLRYVPPAQLEPVHPEALGQFVHLRLHGERGLGVAVAAHRARVRVVGVGDRRVEADVRHAVEARDGREHHVGGRRAPGGVGAVVDRDVGVAREQAPVAVRRGAQANRARLAGRARDELLHAVELDLHRPPNAPGEERRDHVDRVEVEAAAEVAAHRRLQHTHAVARDPERRREVALIEERDLGRRPHREALAAPVPLGDRDHRPQARRRHERQAIRILDDRRRRRERAVHVAVDELVAERVLVGAELLVDQRGALRERRRRVVDRRQLCVLDLDELERRLGDLGRLGGDRRDLVADAADLAALERRLVLGEAERDRLDVGAGQDGEHAGQRPRPRRVDAHEARVRHARAEDPPVGQTRQREVVEVARAPCRLLGAVALLDGFADDVERVGHAQNLTGSLCSPKTSCMARAISPSVA